MWTAACDWLTERAGGIFALSLKRRVLVGAWQNITRDAIYSRARPALGQGDNEEHRSPPMTLKPRRPCWNALNTASVIWRCPRGKWYERLLGRAGKQLAAGRHLKSSRITMLSLIIDIRKANKQRRARSFPFSTVWGLLNINNSLSSVRNSLSVFIYVLHRYMWKKTNRTAISMDVFVLWWIAFFAGKSIQTVPKKNHRWEFLISLLFLLDVNEIRANWHFWNIWDQVDTC